LDAGAGAAAPRARGGLGAGCCFPALDALDAALAAALLPPWARLALYGALSGALTMAVYRLVSDQAGIRALKAESRGLQGRLRAAGDDLASTMRLTRANLAVSLRLLLKSLWPALAASLPVVAVIAWLAVSWSVPMPAPGAPVALAAAPGRGRRWRPSRPGRWGPGPAGGSCCAGRRPTRPSRSRTRHTGRWSTPATGRRPPGASSRTGVVETTLLRQPAATWPTGRRSERRDPAGLPAREVLGLRPGWARGYERHYSACWRPRSRIKSRSGSPERGRAMAAAG
jgi:hypothetical protein